MLKKDHDNGESKEPQTPTAKNVPPSSRRNSLTTHDSFVVHEENTTEKLIKKINAIRKIKIEEKFKGNLFLDVHLDNFEVS